MKTLSNRARNVLLTAGIKFRDLPAMHPQNVQKQRGCGDSSFVEIENALAVFGVHIGMGTPELIDQQALAMQQKAEELKSKADTLRRFLSNPETA